MLGLMFAWITQEIIFAAEGKLVYDTLHSRALEGNLLGDSADRQVIIYLPPSYKASPNRRYPVVYLLHGYTMRAEDWVGGGTYKGLFNILPGLNRFMSQNPNREMIVVMPDAYNKYQGSWYANSPVTGNWEDFIVQELVQHVDTTYRTQPQVASRGMAGYSMGGVGAWMFAMRYPDIYGAVYSLSGGGPLEKIDFIVDENTWRASLSLKTMGQFLGSSLFVRAQIAIAAAFSPNPDNPPFFADYPFELIDGKLKKVEPIWQKWVSGFDVVALAHKYKANLRRLRGIRFGFGNAESGIKEGRAVSEALTKLGIPHVFEKYSGGHADNLNGRVETKVLPFFADVLVYEMSPVETSIRPESKLATAWGRVKR
jgi:enterochelin esterase-like enzyme